MHNNNKKKIEKHYFTNVVAHITVCD